MTYHIVIPNWHPYRTNQWAGRHWAVKHAMRGEMADYIGTYAKQQNVPAATGRRSVKICLEGWARSKFPDRDAYDKLLLDALVEARMLVDDSPKQLSGRVEVEFIRSCERRTTIVLEEVDSGEHEIVSIDRAAGPVVPSHSADHRGHDR